MKNILSYVLSISMLITPLISLAGYPGYNPTKIEPSGPPEIIFPVEGGASFTDDFGDPRGTGRNHEGNDLLAPKMTNILAAKGGVITFMPTTEPSYGYMITIAGDDGYTYNYIHINNDTPGTDDDKGGVEYAYAPGLKVGDSVVQGQHIAWVGDSGNAESVASHLHFEIRLPDDTPIDPYPYLNQALDISSYNIAKATENSPSINADKGLTDNQADSSACDSGTLIKIASSSSVYYCGADGKRYVFPNDKVYKSWYDDFSKVTTISLDEIAKIPLGGNVTYRPGVKLVKIQTDPKVYAVDRNGTLRVMLNPSIAEKYYGKDWNKKVDDIPDSFFVNYKIGEEISS